MKRRWFQIHLSTAVFLMIEAGIFVGLGVYLDQKSEENRAMALIGQTPRNREKIEKEFNSIDRRFGFAVFSLEMLIVTGFFAELAFRMRETRGP